MSELPQKFIELDDQPSVSEWTIADDVFVRYACIERRGSFVPQHAHRYGHLTFLATGRIRAWKDGVYFGEFTAPAPIYIEAGAKHMFETLSDNTTILCIHNASRPDVAAVVAEHDVAVEA